MSKQKTHSKKQDSAREKIINEVTPLLNSALTKLKESLGEKKFEKRIRKAAKVLVHGIKGKTVKDKVSPKKAVAPKKAVKKAIKTSKISPKAGKTAKKK